jgi:hypothetical protein
MTVVYWVAAAAALISGVEAGAEFARDRSPVLAAWLLSMMAISAGMTVAAVVPTVSHGGSELVASACAGLGVVGT